jgi:succinate dehydrogenase / fumarate reductase membrane anchor subunit
MRLKTPLGRVLGLGAAGTGVGHWWQQRVTAAALAPLGLWFVIALVGLETATRAAVVDWIGSPLNAALLALLVLTAAWHSLLGTQVIVEDYVDGAGKVILLVLSQFVHVAAAAIGVMAILRLAIGGQ